jgi:hypothetical protein
VQELVDRHRRELGVGAATTARVGGDAGADEGGVDALADDVDHAGGLTARDPGELGRVEHGPAALSARHRSSCSLIFRPAVPRMRHRFGRTKATALRLGRRTLLAPALRPVGSVTAYPAASLVLPWAWTRLGRGHASQTLREVATNSTVRMPLATPACAPDLRMALASGASPPRSTAPRAAAAPRAAWGPGCHPSRACAGPSAPRQGLAQMPGSRHERHRRPRRPPSARRPRAPSDVIPQHGRGVGARLLHRDPWWYSCLPLASGTYAKCGCNCECQASDATCRCASCERLGVPKESVRLNRPGFSGGSGP